MYTNIGEREKTPENTISVKNVDNKKPFKR